MDHREYLKIPNKLKECRKERGLRQKDVAKFLGLRSAGLISRWETGKSFPSVRSLLALTYVYHVTCDDLFWDLRKALSKEVAEGERRFIESRQNAA